MMINGTHYDVLRNTIQITIKCTIEHKTIYYRTQR